MTTTPDAPASDLTPSEMFDSLTGFDEVAIVRSFGCPITDFTKNGRTPNGAAFLRSLIFVHRKREGDKDALAYKAAMEMRVGDAQNYFAEDVDDDEGDDTAEEAGPFAQVDDEDDAGKAATSA